MATLRHTPLLAIKPASVKAGQVIVPVLIGVGEWVEISATPAVWADLAASVQAAQDRPKEIEAKRQASRRRRSDAERAAAGEPIPKPGATTL